MIRMLVLAVGGLALLVPAGARGDGSAALANADGESSIAYAPDGTWLVTAGSGKSVRIRDATTGAILASLDGHRTIVTAVGVSPDGRTIASAGTDGALRFWDAASRTARRELFIPVPASRRGASLRTQLYVRIIPKDCWRWADWAIARLSRKTGGLLNAVIDPIPPGRHAVISLAYSPDGQTVATGELGGMIRLWDVEAGTVRASWPAGPVMIGQVLYSPDGSILASVGGDGVVRLWDARTHFLLHAFPPRDNINISMAFSPDGATLAMSDHFSVSLWDPRTRHQKAHIPDCPASALAFSPDGQYLATAGMLSVRLFVVGRVYAQRPDPWTIVDEIPDPDSCRNLAYAPDGTRLALVYATLVGGPPEREFKLVGIR